MSFFEKAGKAYNAFGKAVQQKQKELEREAERREQRVNMHKRHYEDLSDREVYEKYKTTDNREIKMACAMILEERGYERS